MIHTQHADVDTLERAAGANGTALLTPDRESSPKSDPWSDYPDSSPSWDLMCASGDDLDGDEAYFLENEDDDDEDDDEDEGVDDDYDDDYEDDDEMDEKDEDSEEDDDDEEL